MQTHRDGLVLQNNILSILRGAVGHDMDEQHLSKVLVTLHHHVDRRASTAWGSTMMGCVGIAPPLLASRRGGSPRRPHNSSARATETWMGIITIRHLRCWSSAPQTTLGGAMPPSGLDCPRESPARVGLWGSCRTSWWRGPQGHPFSCSHRPSAPEDTRPGLLLTWWLSGRLDPC